MTTVRRPDPDRLRVPGAAFLLSQLGFHSGRLWKERLAPLGVDPQLVMVLRLVASDEGRSQQALGRALHIAASRMVGLIDDLEERGLVERRANPDDRRARSLHVTPAGRKLLGRLMEVSKRHEDDLTRGLTPDERKRLVELLGRIAEEQGLTPGVHPGVGGPAPDEPPRRGPTRAGGGAMGHQ
jgi:DNA-binding MarR family transcriptional regulator